MSIDVTNTPIGGTVVVANTHYIKSIFTRASQSEGLIELRDPSTGKLVMKVSIDMNTGVQRPTWFDWDFWTVKINGKQIAREAGAAQGSMRWNPESRTIDIQT
jgi:hypothetical protein